jgi:HKD family nuclease
MAELIRFVSQPWTATRVGDELLDAFNGPYTRLVVSVGFANASGVRYLATPLSHFRENGGTTKFVVGVDGSITSAAGVRALLRLVDELWLFRNPARPLFHPKTFLFLGETQGLAIVGSANLTESALWINYEDAAVIELDLTEPQDQEIAAQLERSSSEPTDTPNAQRADETLVDQLEEAGLLPSEARRRQRTHLSETRRDRDAADSDVARLFPPAATAAPPATDLLPEEELDLSQHPAPSPLPSSNPPTASTHRVFVLRLGPRDVGAQPGFSPDVFIPLAALNHDTAFWKRDTFTQMVTDEGNEYEERYATVEFRRRNGDVEVESRRLYYYPRRAEFRFNTSQIHGDAVAGDLLLVEIAAPGLGFEYTAQVLRPGDGRFAFYDAIASHTVTNSDKRWGYA